MKQNSSGPSTVRSSSHASPNIGASDETTGFNTLEVAIEMAEAVTRVIENPAVRANDRFVGELQVAFGGIRGKKLRPTVLGDITLHALPAFLVLGVRDFEFGVAFRNVPVERRDFARPE